MLEFELEWDKKFNKPFDFKILKVSSDRTKSVRNLFEVNGIDAEEFTKRFLKKVKDIK